MADNKVLLIVIAIFIPPLAVFLKENNQITNNFWINLVATLLCGIPGVIHAIYLILTQ